MSRCAGPTNLNWKLKARAGERTPVQPRKRSQRPLLERAARPLVARAADDLSARHRPSSGGPLPLTASSTPSRSSSRRRTQIRAAHADLVRRLSETATASAPQRAQPDTCRALAEVVQSGRLGRASPDARVCLYAVVRLPILQTPAADDVDEPRVLSAASRIACRSGRPDRACGRARRRPEQVSQVGRPTLARRAKRQRGRGVGRGATTRTR